jgi:hypothetical protein
MCPDWTEENRRIESTWSTRRSSLTISAKLVGAGAVSQQLIPMGERSGLLTHIATMEHAVKALMYGLTRRKLWSGMVKVKGL